MLDILYFMQQHHEVIVRTCGGLVVFTFAIICTVLLTGGIMDSVQTGRMQCKEPNISNIAKSAKLGKGKQFVIKSKRSILTTGTVPGTEVRFPLDGDDGTVGMSVRVPYLVHVYLQRKAAEGERSVSRQYRKALTEWVEISKKSDFRGEFIENLKKKN